MSYTFFVDRQFNDFRISNGEMVFARGQDVVIQQIRIALNVEFGEWFLNTEQGIPYYSSTGTLNDNNTPGILGGKFSAAEISAVMRKTILEVPNVISIQNFSLVPVENRGIIITASVMINTFDINGVGTQQVIDINIEV